MGRFTIAALAGFSFALAGCDFDDFDAGDRAQADFHYSYPLKAGGTVSVETFNGSVEVVGWDQNTVEVSGTKYARNEQLRDEIKIETTHTDGEVNVRAVRPLENHGNMGARFVLHVPKKCELGRIVSSNGHIEVRDVQGAANLRTSNGRINAEAVNGPLEASTSNGRITVHQTNGNGRAPAHLRTSNGTIELTADQPLKGDLHATTSNGSITLRLPAATSARLRASTSNAGISTDFEVTSQGRLEKHHLEGSLNHATGDAPMIDVSTSNGSIRLVKM